MLITRRAFLKASLAAAAYAAAPSLAYAYRASRKLHLYNVHTGESVKTTYFENGEYIPGALKEIDKVLRDHRTGEVLPMDRPLLDLIELLHAKMETTQPFEVISGFRSPQSNALLYKTTSGVASNSYHMYGRAMDVRLSNRATKNLRAMAWNMQLGGVGYYPDSDFVHVDTGKVRSWDNAPPA